MTTAIKSYLDVPGWFYWFDRAVFDAILDAQDEHGDLVELGAYLGRSAVIIGDHLREGERFVVIDLFGDEPNLGDDARDAANRAENQYSYKSLDRQKFESNYLALHSQLPEVVQGLSSTVVDHVKPGSARFVHIDASHLYDQVAEDVRNARQLLQPNGVVVFDDYRSEHTPGVAAAVWEAVAADDLHPFAITTSKMYATWGDAARWLDVTRDLARRDDRIRLAPEWIRQNTVLRISGPASKPAAPAALSDADLGKIATQVADLVDAKQQKRAKERSATAAKSRAEESVPVLARKLGRRLAARARRG